MEGPFQAGVHMKDKTEKTNNGTAKKLSPLKIGLIAVGALVVLVIILLLAGGDDPGEPYDDPVDPDPVISTTVKPVDDPDDPGSKKVEDPVVDPPEDPVDDPAELEPIPSFSENEIEVASVEEIIVDTDAEGNPFYLYSSEDTEFALEIAEEGEISEAESLAEKVVYGETEGKNWTAVSTEGLNTVLYMNVGDSVVKTTVGSSKDTRGIEETAKIVSAVVSDRKDYSESTSWNHDYETFYIEAADCILYYPAQLSKVKKYENNTFTFSDTKSTASLYVSLSSNEYSSMDELEGFIRATENNQVIAYGPAWYTCETRTGDNITFTYVGLGSEFIVNAALTYPKSAEKVYLELRKLLYTKFVNEGIWVSEAHAGYDRYGDSFSKNMETWYDYENNLCLAYPEIFSVRREYDDKVVFTDPVTGAAITYEKDTSNATVANFSERYDAFEYKVKDERAILGLDRNKGYYVYGYQPEKGSMTVASVNYDPVWDWVYGSFAEKIKIFSPKGDPDIRFSVRVIEEYGLLVNIPERFRYQGAYDNKIYYEDPFNGFKMAITLQSVSNKAKENIYEAYNVVAEDRDVKLFDHELRWSNGSGMYIAAVGLNYQALMEMSYPNVKEAYGDHFGLFRMNFAVKPGSAEAEMIKAAAEAAAHRESLQKQESTGKPNDPLVYRNAEDYAVMLSSCPEWFIEGIEKDGIEVPEGADNGEYLNYYLKRNEEHRRSILYHMLDILAYNNYDLKNVDYESFHRYWDSIDQGWYHYKLGLKVDEDSDIGKGIPSVFEEFCKLLEIKKPVYVTGAFEIKKPSEAEKKVESGKPEEKVEEGNKTEGSGSFIEDEREISKDADSIYEELAEELNITVLGDPGEENGSYGNMSYIDYADKPLSIGDFYEHKYTPELKAFINNLESMGITYTESGSVDVGSPVDMYSGYLEGYEEYGKLYVLVGDTAGNPEVCWMFERFEDMPILNGEVYVDESFYDYYWENGLYEFGEDTEESERINLKCIYRVSSAAHYLQKVAESMVDDPEAYTYVLAGSDDPGNDWYGLSVCRFKDDGKLEEVFEVVYRPDPVMIWGLYHNKDGSWKKLY